MYKQGSLTPLRLRDLTPLSHMLSSPAQTPSLKLPKVISRVNWGQVGIRIGGIEGVRERIRREMTGTGVGGPFRDEIEI